MPTKKNVAMTEQQKKTAVKRLMYDYKEILEHPLPSVTARPVKDENLFLWHANLVGVQGKEI